MVNGTIGLQFGSLTSRVVVLEISMDLRGAKTQVNSIVPVFFLCIVVDGVNISWKGTIRSFKGNN